MSTRRRAAAELAMAGGTIAIAIMSMAAPSGADSSGPTCSDVLGIAVHGQHIVGDYVTGIGHDALGWPPNGQVGAAIAGEGVVLTRWARPGLPLPERLPAWRIVLQPAGAIAECGRAPTGDAVT